MREKLKDLCHEKGTTIAALEQELGFSNGALRKTDNIRSDRLCELAKYFDVSTDYLLGIDNIHVGIPPKNKTQAALIYAMSLRNGKYSKLDEEYIGKLTNIMKDENKRNTLRNFIDFLTGDLNENR